MTALVGTICSITFGALGFLISYITFSKKKDADARHDGESRGALASDVGYIKAGVDDLKRESRETRKEIGDLSERVTRVEESTKQAHKRLDRISPESHN